MISLRRKKCVSRILLHYGIGVSSFRLIYFSETKSSSYFRIYFPEYRCSGQGNVGWKGEEEGQRWFLLTSWTPELCRKTGREAGLQNPNPAGTQRLCMWTVLMFAFVCWQERAVQKEESTSRSKGHSLLFALLCFGLGPKVEAGNILEWDYIATKGPGFNRWHLQVGQIFFLKLWRATASQHQDIWTKCIKGQIW